jgi:hypothetical protein
MKRIYLSPYLSLSLIAVFCVGMALFITHAIANVNFQYVNYPQDLLGTN